jgi:hypothetical protein
LLSEVEVIYRQCYRRNPISSPKPHHHHQPQYDLFTECQYTINHQNHTFTTDIMKIPAWVSDGTEVDEETYGKDLAVTDVGQITAAQATGHLINFFNNCK